MEVKVTCACGTRYKFDVEPVNNRMPWPVACPACGADGTALANKVIAGATAGSPPPVVRATVVSATPPSMAAAPAPGLRISQPPPQAAPPPAPPPLSAAPPRFASSPQPRPKTSSGFVKVMAGLLTFLIVGFGTYRAVRKLMGASRLVTALEEIKKAVDEEKSGTTRQWNLEADDQVILYIRHENHTEIAQECVAFWKQKYNHTLKVTVPMNDSGDGADYLIAPSHNGYVRLYADQRSWKDPQFEAAAKHLSEKFSTMVFVEKDVDFTGEFVFGVYDQGTNLFHARMDVKMGADEPEEKVTTEHNEWALANGYKPGPNGFKDFNIRDANELTKRFGMKFWDEPDDRTNYIVLLDPAVKPR